MRQLKLAASAYLAVMAGWVIVHFSEHTLFEDHAEESVEAGGRSALDFFMALAFLVAAIASYLDTRRGAKESPPPPGWLASRLFFYLVVLVAIPFFANWFASLGHTDDGILWIYVETMGPLTWGIQAVRIWRGARTPGRVAA
ncbi:MAG: hypothetical protein OXI56_06260 [bacterium]|nr:hypothetical protein [bacterium]MDE0601383.1 hypothetical protein [bacterium]